MPSTRDDLVSAGSIGLLAAALNTDNTNPTRSQQIPAIERDLDLELNRERVHEPVHKPLLHRSPFACFKR